jgi:hypothetical protein
MKRNAPLAGSVKRPLRDIARAQRTLTKTERSACAPSAVKAARTAELAPSALQASCRSASFASTAGPPGRYRRLDALAGQRFACKFSTGDQSVGALQAFEPPIKYIAPVPQSGSCPTPRPLTMPSAGAPSMTKPRPESRRISPWPRHEPRRERRAAPSPASPRRR